ncbi:hypothetical protein ABPG77_001463 [Micractinium sp. CCAP 211/92]
MRAGPWLALASWWLAAAAVAALLPVATAQGCTLTLLLNATASAISMNGSAVDTTKPLALRVDFVPAHPEAALGFEGALSLVLAGTDPCPTAAADVLPRLVGAQVQTTDITEPLLLYPTGGIQLNGNPGVVNLTLLENYFAISSTPLVPAADDAFTTDLTGLSTNGTVLSKSLAAPAPEVLSVTGMNDTKASTVAATVQGSTLTLTLSVSWLMPSYYESQSAGITYAGTNNYAFTGQIVAQATLGCLGNCSAPNGRCVTAADGTAGCTCSCGWAGPNCDIASGFCSSFPAELQGQAQVCPSAPAPAPAPPASGPCQAQVCNERQQYNASTGSCDCRAGWEGPGCDACQTDAVCDSYFSTSGATCSDEVAFQQGMQFKAYTCDLTNSGLKGIIEPGTFYMVCNTSALPPGQEAASSVDQACTVHFTLSQAKDNPVTCTASECSFRANSSSANCVSTHCECQTPGCAVQNILDDVEGKPCSIDCTADSTCSFNIQDFIFDLVAPCQMASCVVPGYTFVEGDYRITTSKSYNPVIAAVPMMVLVALAAFLSLYLTRHRALFSSRRHLDAAAAAVSGAAAAASVRQRPSNPVHLLTFDGVSCAVPVQEGRGWRRWLRRSKAAAEEGQPAAAEAGATANVTASHPQQKLILRSVSGAAACGELVGVLGPSGSGKTTLLAMLAGSSEDLDRRSTLTGSVCLDGQPLSAANRRRIGFVPQDDSMLPTLTVEECIRYSAILRLPHASAAEVQASVQSVVAELGLQHVARSRVGGRSGIRGISGGERRRVTIGMELVTAPAVLVLDEPTSGLDSYTALNLMRTLKQVASAGRIVLLSFHQPSPAMFSLLDSSYLMARGRCIFAGPPASTEAWFAQRGLPCPVGTAIAEHMLDAVSDPGSLQQLLAAHDGEQPASAADMAHGSGAAHAHASSVAATDGGKTLRGDAVSSCAKLDTVPLSNGASDGDVSAACAAAEMGMPLSGKGSPGGVAAAAAPQWRPSLSRELAVVFWRTLVDIVRNPALLLLHWVLALLMGAFVGAVFFDVSFDVSGAQNRVGGMFFVLCFFAFTSLTTVDLLMMERRMVLREVRGGFYRPGSYLLAKMVLDALLLRVIPVFIFSAAFYPMMGLQSGASTVATFLMVLAAFAGAMGALSLSVTVGSSTAGLASLIMNILLLIAVVVSGMLVNPQSMPAWIRWTHWLSPFYYAYCSLMINEMSGIKIDFELKGYAAAKNVRGTVFLETIGINADDLTTDIIVNDCYYLGLALLAFALLYLVMPRPRWAGPAARKA